MHRMEKQNRAERRKSKFGGGRATDHGGWPSVQPNPVFGGTDAPEDATAGAPTQDQTGETGGATEPAGRAIRNVGTRAGDSTKG